MLTQQEVVRESLRALEGSVGAQLAQVVGSIGPSRLRVFPRFACLSRAQGSSGTVATMPFVWRSHAKSPATRAGRALDIALRLE